MISKKTKIYKRWVNSKGTITKDFAPFATDETVLKTTYSFLGIPVFIIHEIIHRHR